MTRDKLQNFISGSMTVSPPDRDGDIEFELGGTEYSLYHYMPRERVAEFIEWLKRVADSANGESNE